MDRFVRTLEESILTVLDELERAIPFRPAVKAIVWDADLAYLPVAPAIRNGHYDAPAPMAFADGHSDLKNPADAREGASNPLNGGATTRLHNTPEGVLGADY